MKKEALYEKVLADKKLVIKQMAGDGNCLFRAVSDQLYGTQKFHFVIRKVCMEYIEIEKDFYLNYVTGSGKEFSNYINWKSKDGVWGDDIEIQAMSEIYQIGIEIYAYKLEPMRTFHESNQKQDQKVIRITYHGKSHFNSLKEINNLENGILETKFGQLEKKALMNAKKCLELRKMIQIQTKDSNLHPEIFQMNQALEQSRQEFEHKGKRDMEVALEESLTELKQKKGKKEENLEEVKKRSFDLFDINSTEQRILESVMNKTKQESELFDQNLSQVLQQSLQEYNKDVQGQQMYEMQPPQPLYSPQIMKVLQAGFSLQQAIQAQSIVGENPEDILSYLYSQIYYQ